MYYTEKYKNREIDIAGGTGEAIRVIVGIRPAG
jgi:hypothetical protein